MNLHISKQVPQKKKFYVQLKKKKNNLPSSWAVFVTVPSSFIIKYGAVNIKLRNAKTGQGDCPFRGKLGAPCCVAVSFMASAKAFLKDTEEGSKLEIRNQ